jgi:hypothetical protein
MKRLVMTVVVFAMGIGLAIGGPVEFSKGNFFLTPQVGFASWGGSIPFGVNAEYAISENIGVGGTAMAQFWSDTWGSVSWIMLSAEANYHFIKLNASKFDLYVGAGIGYGIYSVSYGAGFMTGGTGSSGLILEPIAGGRYYFSPNMAISLRLVGSVLGGYTGFGATVGVTFKLK